MHDQWISNQVWRGAVQDAMHMVIVIKFSLCVLTLLSWFIVQNQETQIELSMFCENKLLSNNSVEDQLVM